MARLIIPLCRFCAIQGKCDLKERLISHTRTIPMKLTLLHNCKAYSGTFKKGAIVEVELKSVEVEPEKRDWDGDIIGGGEFEWHSMGWAKGRIVAVPDDKRRFFTIKLDKKANLTLIPRGLGPQNAQEFEVEYIRKASKDIRFISAGIQEEDQKAEEAPF